MTKSEHIDYWVKSSEEDFEVFELLLSNKKYVYAFYIAHLSIEKLLKALWVKNKESNIPPKIHNLSNLAKLSQANLSAELKKFLTQLNDFQIQGRYPDYRFKINQLLTDNLAADLANRYEDLRKCLKISII